ncbi:MAG TPA: ribosome small subunit-dependent GTPase A [Tepidisphaeraceae bacterium]|nr:ribosome small subunit-dependent GTPase A [Tepidisphaeraceae bacterium]
MTHRRRKSPREKDLTSRFLDGDDETDRLESQQRFSQRSKNAQQNKMEQTALLRAAEQEQSGDIESLPIGQVMQVYSLYCEVDHPSGQRLCVVRKTLASLAGASMVVGDYVRFRDTPARDEIGRAEAVIEQVLPRKTVLTRADSFQERSSQPIVANADQVLIVASLLRPRIKWGLVDRMLVAAQSGGLRPLLCLNKIDLAEENEKSGREYAEALEALRHYQALGIATYQTSAEHRAGIESVAGALEGKTTVLGGHSGAGKSTLISLIQPGLDIRIGAVSNYNEKGRHTTTSARRYPLDIGGYVIDTPGIKMFGLWGVSEENLRNLFPDVENGTAPDWRRESYERIEASLRG